MATTRKKRDDDDDNESTTIDGPVTFAGDNHGDEWAAARTAMIPLVIANWNERKRTFELMASGAPMYGVAADAGGGS